MISKVPDAVSELPPGAVDHGELDHGAVGHGAIGHVAVDHENSTSIVPELTVSLERDLVQVFKLLADETRLRILFYLMREGELHVTALCERLAQSQPAVSHHLALLRVAGIIEPRRDGKHNFYSVRTEHFHRIMAELFGSMLEPGSEGLRFRDFLLKQDQAK